MNDYIAVEISDFSQKENGYLTLFYIRLGILNVKADPQSMLPVTVTLGDTEYNFEDVADATKPDDYTFDVTPKNDNNTMAIVKGVFEMHPEFKVKVMYKEFADGSKKRHIVYTMPDVDKDRRDLLKETSNIFYNECLVKLEAAYTKRLADTVQLFLKVPDEADDAKKTFKKIYEVTKDNAEKLLNLKLDEIEEGYQRYLMGEDNEWKNDYKEDTDFDLSELS